MKIRITEISPVSHYYNQRDTIVGSVCITDEEIEPVVDEEPDGFCFGPQDLRFLKKSLKHIGCIFGFKYEKVR